MNALNYAAAIKMRRINRDYRYGGVIMLTLSAEYPEVLLPYNPRAQAVINREISAQVGEFIRYASGELYKDAIEHYKYTQENGYPFNHYDAVLNYTLTYNQNCYLSLYHDRYIYQGGAHGNTVRASDSRSLTSGRRLTLESIFQSGQDYRALLIEQILILADEQMQQNPGIYFEDYRTLIAENFNEQSFYLTPDGLAVYYQQYDIAPYSSGIIVFTIPYEVVGWYPVCESEYGNER